MRTRHKHEPARRQIYTMARINKPSRIGQFKQHKKRGNLGIARVSGQNAAPTAPELPAGGTPEDIWRVIMELGGSHNLVRILKPGQNWQFVTWDKGNSPGNIGGVDVVPTITALMEVDGKLEVRHGWEAYKARMMHDGWTTFQNLKIVYADAQSNTNEQIEQTLRSQEQIAIKNGWDIHDIADKFFTFLLEKATEGHTGPVVLTVNITDLWTNAAAQRLTLGLQRVLPRCKVRSVNEVFASVIGALARNKIIVSEPTSLLYVDCGHTTMVRTEVSRNATGSTDTCPQNIAILTLDKDDKNEPCIDLHKWKSPYLGAERINTAAKNVVYRLNEAAGVENGNARVWEISEWIDNHFKTDVNGIFSARPGFTDAETQEIIKESRKANDELDQDRIELMCKFMEHPKFDSVNGHIISTGLAGRSKTLNARLAEKLSESFDKMILHKDNIREG